MYDSVRVIRLNDRPLLPELIRHDNMIDYSDNSFII
jgi:hypothetical protein